SSRRRHTRWPRDWSSDVCSSDLPLTALHLQTGMLARASGDAERAAAMETLSAGVQRAIRLVEQMLALARQEPRAEAQRVAVRLDDLAREIVAELVPLADAGRIDLG